MIKVTIKFEEVEEEKVDKHKKHLVLGDYSYALNSELKPATIMAHEGYNMCCEIVNDDIVVKSKNCLGNVEILDVCVKSLKTGKIYFTQSRFFKRLTEMEIALDERMRNVFRGSGF